MRTVALVLLLTIMVASISAQCPPDISITDGNPLFDRFAQSVAAVGDLDSDGYDDFVVGIPSIAAGSPGRAYVYSGKTRGLIHAIYGQAWNDNFGFSVAGIGDVDADGVPDFAVGAPDNDEGAVNGGRVYVYSGASPGIIYTFTGTATGEKLGWAIAGVGDLNLDGFPDLAVGSPQYSVGLSQRGKLTAYSGINGTALWTVLGDTANFRLGFSVSAAGLVDANAFPDVAVGAVDPVGTYSGRAYVLSGVNGTKIRSWAGNFPGDQFGWSVAPAGDYNSDGSADVLIGMPRSDNETGYVFVKSGGAVNTTLAEYPGISGYSIGTSVSSGDLDGDGKLEYIAGVAYADDFATDAGAIAVFGRTQTGTILHLLGTLETTTTGGLLGTAVAFAGDINNDGLDDIIGAAPGTGPAVTPYVHIWLSGAGCYNYNYHGHLGVTPEWSCAGLSRETFNNGGTASITGQEALRITTTANADGVYFRDVTLALASTDVQFRAKRISGTSGTFGRSGMAVKVITGGVTAIGNVLVIAKDSVFFLKTGDIPDTIKLLDTDDDFHTYRIVNSLTPTGTYNLTLYYDGNVVLHGSSYENATIFNYVPEVAFGDVFTEASGISEWQFERHNNNAISDTDGDGFPDDCDNCPGVYNPDQIDTNGDGIGEACESDFRAESNLRPNQVCPVWSENLLGGASVPVFSGDTLVISTSAAGEQAYYEQLALGFSPSNGGFTVEFGLKHISGAASGVNTGTAIAIFLPSKRGNILFFTTDKIFVWSSYGVKGDSALVDTDDAFHDYRLIIEPNTGGGARLYQDGNLILSPTWFVDVVNWPATERIWWGDGTSATSAVSKWTYFRHNGSSFADDDGDGAMNACDNCPTVSNFDQVDTDLDGIGDRCDLSFSSTTIDDGNFGYSQVAVADFDKDNKVDYLTADGVAPGHLRILWGGTLAFQSLWTFPCYRFSLGYVDLPPDTLLDIVAQTSSGVRIFKNLGNRVFSAGPPLMPEFQPVDPQVTPEPAVAVGYFDNDTYADVVATPNLMYRDVNSPSFSSTTLPFSFDGVAVADFTNDGLDDLALAMGDSLQIYPNKGNAVFERASAVRSRFHASDIATVLASVDFNRDGLSDVVVTTSKSSLTNDTTEVTVVLGDGFGGMSSTQRLTILGTARDVTTPDVNGDRYLDLCLANGQTNTLHFYLNDSTGHFGAPFTQSMPAGSGQLYAVASGDGNRDGNTDFVSGGTASNGIIVMTNLADSGSILVDELHITGYSAEIAEVNPGGLRISRLEQSVAGSSYGRLDANGDGLLDTRAIDYNLQYGEYGIVMRPYPGLGDNTAVGAVIGINGSQQATIFKGYSDDGSFLRSPSGSMWSPDSILFYYTVELTPSMSPANGIQTPTRTPQFKWSKLVDSTSTKYHFQLSRYFDLRTPLYDDSTRLSTSFTPPSPLGADSVFYWRARAFKDGVWSGWTRTMAAYIGFATSCCIASTGNVDCDGGDGVDISDLSALIDFLYISFTPPCCIEEANVDGQPGTDISDLSALIDYLYISFTPTAACQ